MIYNHENLIYHMIWEIISSLKVVPIISIPYVSMMPNPHGWWTLTHHPRLDPQLPSTLDPPEWKKWGARLTMIQPLVLMSSATLRRAVAKGMYPRLKKWGLCRHTWVLNRDISLNIIAVIKVTQWCLLDPVSTGFWMFVGLSMIVLSIAFGCERLWTLDHPKLCNHLVVHFCGILTIGSFTSKLGQPLHMLNYKIHQGFDDNISTHQINSWKHYETQTKP